MDTKIKVRNPATGEIIKDIFCHTPKEINQILEDGNDAFETWKKVDAHKRSDLLKEWSNLIKKHKKFIAKILTQENGKPLKESNSEIDYATSYIDWYAEEAKRIYGRSIPSHTNDKRLIVKKQPVGLVGAITPWNFPAAMMTRKAAPALAAGCTFVVKPAIETPLTAMHLIKLAHEAGIPENVIQYVNGRGGEVGGVFTSSNFIQKITFTGSTDVGKLLVKNSADTLKKVTMELGGHAPVIVAEDANIDLAVKQVIASKFRNAGQTCICANRVLVHESILDEFSNKLKKSTENLIVGNGLESDVDIGPVINESSFNKIAHQIEDAVDKGAKVISGAEYDINEQTQSYFVHPTILRNVTADMLIMHEETFGPVAPIYTFSNLNEAIEIANDSPFGLAAYFFTENYKAGVYLFEHLDYGIVGWNDGAVSAAHAPFGGIKESGIGREGGIEGIEHYLETKFLSIGGL